MKIFTFWEPRKNVPGYIQLCMKTWEKFLPEAEVVVCDYQTMRNYLSDEEFESIDFRNMSLAKQSDAIRCALLKKHGGIWLDADTIITSSEGIQQLQQGHCCMLNNGKPHTLFGAYIYTAEPNTEFINRWHEELVPRIAAYKKAWKYRMFRIFFLHAWKRMKKWDYCENAIIDPIAAHMTPPEFVELAGMELGVIPERNDLRENETPKKAYLRYWFEKRAFTPPLNSKCGVIFLHNSWTPIEYRLMSANEFMKQNIPLAKLLNAILNEI